MSQIIWCLLVFAAISIGRAAVTQNINMLDLKEYARLEQPSPYQDRILMAPVLRWAGTNPLFSRLYEAAFKKNLRSPEDLAVAIVNCTSLLLLLPITTVARRLFSPPPLASWLAPLITLLVVTFTYVVRYEWRWTMPYDLLSMLLFTLGLLAILKRQGWLLLVVVAIGTPNRETVVFLVPAWFLLSLREKRPLEAFGYSAVAVATWYAWRFEISSLLRSSHLPYDFPLKQNLSALWLPTHWPQLFSVFGFLLIPMALLHSLVQDERLRSLWLAMLPYMLAALVVGIWFETRIFGELSALVGITFAVQIETLWRSRPLIEPARLIEVS